MHRPEAAAAAWETDGGRRSLLRHPVTIVLFAAFLAVICGLALHPRAFVAAAALAAIFVFGVVTPWASLRRLRGTLTTERRRARVDEPLTFRLQLRNGWPWPIYGLTVRGGWSETRAEDPVSLSVAKVPALGSVDIEWTVTPPQRGVFPIVPMLAECGFPFGLITSRRRLGWSREVIVWPAMTRLGPARLSGGDEGMTEFVDERRAGSAGEVIGVRVYRPGESLRRIHWPQSARHGQLIVCERSAIAGRGVQVIVETSPAVHFEQNGTASVERAISLAASAASACAEHGSRVSLVFGRDHVFEAENRGALVPVFDALAAFDVAVSAPLRELLELPECRDFDGQLQVVITTAAGYERLEPERRRGFARSWLLVGPAADRRPPGRGLLRVPLVDPQGEALMKAWQEVGHAS